MNIGTAVTPWVPARLRRGKTAAPQGFEQTWDAAIRHVRIPWRSGDSLAVLYGHPAATRLALAEAGHWAMAGEPVVYLDGDQSFDPWFISRLAKARRMQASKILALIHVARVFSGAQMERLAGACLAGALERYQSRHAVVTGAFEMLADECVSERERIRTADRVLESLRQLSHGEFRILCPCPGSDSGVGRRLFGGLRASARRVIRMRCDGGLLTLEDETEALSWEPDIAMAAGH